VLFVADVVFNGNYTAKYFTYRCSSATFLSKNFARSSASIQQKLRESVEVFICFDFLQIVTHELFAGGIYAAIKFSLNFVEWFIRYFATSICVLKIDFRN